MATDAKTQPPRRDSVVGSVNSPEEAAEVVRGFTNALKAFSSEPGFQSLAELVDRIPQLESEVREKEKMLKSANEASQREDIAHENALRKNIQLNNEEVVKMQKKLGSLAQENKNLNTTIAHKDEAIVKIQKQMGNLEQENANLKTKIAQKDDAIAKSEVRETSLKEAGRKIGDSYKALKAKLEAKDGEIAKLQQQNQDSHAKGASLGAELKKTQAEVSTTRASLREAKERAGKLEDALKAVQLQQQEVASYSVPLEHIDPDQLFPHNLGIHDWAGAQLCQRRPERQHAQGTTP
ncbi:hypothetical protein OPT61_g10725 [Boeremia exigua]|uniref:Uncharacterized protein n=1 Tax=Boeremia exigua TaxID=749465 RepID=A0ACC2HN97_9PLEO|nr:hypothetical protein OPT61_g10725 [Boeremia exigua]